MARGKFASSGVTVGSTIRTNREQALQQQKSGKVTMGTGVPRQAEGSVGDITVRKLPEGLRCFIKTDSGWFDINTMKAAPQTVWRPMVLENSWAQHSSTYGEPAYFKDDIGFVHLRGAIKDGTDAANDITTLPPGFRPATTIILPAARNSARVSVKILKTGEVNMQEGGSTSLSFLDGISFYGVQVVVSSGGGSGGGGSGSGGSHGGGGGA